VVRYVPESRSRRNSSIDSFQIGKEESDNSDKKRRMKKSKPKRF
jgi:hypothetical protein